MENEAGASLTVSQSTFTGDLALGGSGGGNAFGGAIDNEAGTVAIDRSTFLGDQALAANGGTMSVGLATPRSLRTRPKAAQVPPGAMAETLLAGASSTTWEPRLRSWRVC